eukprot:gene35903-43550_t
MTTMDSFLKSVFDFNVPLQSLLPPLQEPLPSPIPVADVVESEDDIFRTVQSSWSDKYWDQVQGGRKFPWLNKRRKHRHSKKQQTVIEDIELTTFIEEESCQKDRFTVQFHSSFGLGIRWKVTMSGRVLVLGFVTPAQSDPPSRFSGADRNHLLGRQQVVSVAENSRMVCPGDELVSVDAINVRQLDGLGLEHLLLSIDHLAKSGVSLTFRYTDEDADVEVKDMLAEAAREQQRLKERKEWMDQQAMQKSYKRRRRKLVEREDAELGGSLSQRMLAARQATHPYPSTLGPVARRGIGADEDFGHAQYAEDLEAYLLPHLLQQFSPAFQTPLMQPPGEYAQLQHAVREQGVSAAVDEEALLLHCTRLV